jgi:pSer/pThr/pTyr-binding forkhead associated (FHA) protein
VDGTSVDAGKRVTIDVGATIKIGRAILQLQAGDPTESGAPRPGSLDATLVTPSTPGPGAGAGTAPPREQEQTSGYRGPNVTASGQSKGTTKDTPAEDFGQTMNVKGGFRPGAPPPPTPMPAPPTPTPPAPTPAPPAEDFGQTMNVKGGLRPGSQPPLTPMPASPGDDFGQTMNVKGGFRPGSLPPPTPMPAPPGEGFGQTMDVKGGFRPGAPPPAPTPTPPPAPPPAPPPPPAARDAAEPPAAAAPKKDERTKPKTVLVRTEDIAPPPSAISPAMSIDVEGLLHQAMPRLFVKGETIRRRVRLMKARTKIGRAETADVLLPNESVSEQHAEIEFDGTTWSLRDCGSTNGSFADGQMLRSSSRPIARNSLLGFGTLRGVFLCNDAATAASDRRTEERALHLLVAAGRLAKDVGRQVASLAKRDNSQTIAEILLGDTPIEPADWTNAINAVKDRVTLWDRLRALFSKKAKPPAK